MIDLALLKTNPELIRRALLRRGPAFQSQLDQVTNGETKNPLRQERESLQAEINAASKLIPTLPPAAKKKKIKEMKGISDRLTELKKTEGEWEASHRLEFPNIPADDVPDGHDAASNVVLREVGKKSTLAHPKDYLTLTEPRWLIDTARASKVSGSRFGYILGPIAQLEFALVQYAQSVILPEGFTLVVPPVMISSSNMEAMGYLTGGGESETYHFSDDDLYLVGTSEQSVGPMFRDEVLLEGDVPLRLLSFSTCFRREAGSYGRDTKGILRVHQFDKLEMFSFCAPESSDAEQEFFLSLEEKLMQGLKLPYRVVKLCTGDLSWPSARTYDIETWMPGQGEYRETHSTSTTTDYQSRALNIKLERNGKKELVHMINGTAFAIGRTLIAIIENYQRPNGDIDVPKVLQPYMGGIKRIG